MNHWEVETHRFSWFGRITKPISILLKRITVFLSMKWSSFLRFEFFISFRNPNLEKFFKSSKKRNPPKENFQSNIHCGRKRQIAQFEILFAFLELVMNISFSSIWGKLKWNIILFLHWIYIFLPRIGLHSRC